MSIIRTENLTKFYGKSIGIEDVSIEVKAGEVFGFLGPNGAGKTTTIRTLLALMYPTSGKAFIFDKDAYEHSTEIHKHIGYLPGELTMYDQLTGEQALRYLASLRGGVDWDFVQSLAKRFDSDLTKRVQSLSTGNKRKIGLIQALMHRPKLLILDEPTSGLDPLMQQEFYDLLLEVKKNGQTVFLSSHNLPEIEHVCDRVAFIREGKLVAIEDVAEVKAKSFQHIEVHFGQKVEPEAFDAIEGIQEIELKDGVLRCKLIGNIDPLLKAVAKYKVEKFITHDPHLDDVFMEYYAKKLT